MRKSLETQTLINFPKNGPNIKRGIVFNIKIYSY